MFLLSGWKSWSSFWALLSPSFLSSLQCTICFVHLGVSAHFSSFLHTTSLSRALPNPYIFWAREMHLIPSLSGTPTLHDLKCDGAMLMGACGITGSLEKWFVILPRGTEGSQLRHQFALLDHREKRRKSVLLRVKEIWKNTTEEVSMQCGCPPPVLGLLP